MLRLDKFLCQTVVLLLLVLTTAAQVNETEPNNDCRDEGVLKIRNNGTYSGTVVDGNPDMWQIKPHSPGYVHVSIDVESEDELDPVIFEVLRYDHFELTDHCFYERRRTGGSSYYPTSFEIITAKYGSHNFIRVEVNDKTPRNYTLTISGNPMKIFSGGAGTEDRPYKISTPGNLDSVRYFPDAHFVQTADIDLNVAPYNSGSGWNPIGSGDNPFTGVYDGDKYTISNLYINRPTSDWVALFGDLLHGELRDIGLVNVDITADYNVAALVGRNRALVEECYSTGKIDAVHNVGGLVGRNISDDGSDAEIKNSYSIVDIEASGNFSGGLVGVFSSGKIENCYSAGKVDGTNADGGLLGSNSGDVVSSFWDIDASGLDWSAGGSGKNTNEMKSSSTFLSEGWSRIEWRFSGKFNDGYPHFLWQELDGSGESISGSGGKYNSSSSSGDFLKGNPSTLTEENKTHEFNLQQNYPNPFNPTTTINFTVPSVDASEAKQSVQTSLKIYDILGKEVVTLINQNLQPGNHKVQFDGSNLSSGTYFYRIDIGREFSLIKKMLLIK